MSQEMTDKVVPEEVDETTPLADQIASKADVDAVLVAVDKNTEAVQELTKVVGELQKENVKWFRAGKMGGPNG